MSVVPGAATHTDTVVLGDTHSEAHGRTWNVWENVLAYGAVGDGVHDDTAAFQAAIDTGKRVYVPRTSSHYVITNRLNVTSSAGLNMLGDFPSPGTSSRIMCNNFPANTDVIKLPDGVVFPTLHLENLYFSNSAGQKPRDFHRMTTADNQRIVWRDVQIEKMGGYGYNVPAGMECVSPHMDNVQILECALGGVYMHNYTAAFFNHCRFAANGYGADGDFKAGAGWASGGVSGLTLVSPVFDGDAPGSANIDRLTIFGTFSLIEPYFEWGGVATGILRNIKLDHATGVVYGGAGGNAMSGAYTMTLVEISASTSVTLIALPWPSWIGSGPLALKVTTSSDIEVFNGPNASQMSIDASTGQTMNVRTTGKVLRDGGATNLGILTATGTTFNIDNGRYIRIANAVATNINQMTGGAYGQIVTLVATNANTTLVHGGIGNNYFVLRGGVNHTMAANEAISFILINGGGDYWQEIGR